MKTLIFDTNIGFLQWISDEPDDMEALVEFDAKIGIAKSNKLPPWERDAMTEDEIMGYESPLSLSDWRFYHVDNDMAAQVEAWAARGSPAAEFPLSWRQPPK